MLKLAYLALALVSAASAYLFGLQQTPDLSSADQVIRWALVIIITALVAAIGYVVRVTVSKMPDLIRELIAELRALRIAFERADIQVTDPKDERRKGE